MDRPLLGRSILVVEDEPLIAMDVAELLKKAGAEVSEARTVRDALCKVEYPDLSAAVVDHILHGEDSSQICDRLDRRNIPFVLYSGLGHVHGPCSEGEQMRKPARPEALVGRIVNLLRQQAGPAADHPS
jgi:DNA-binding response OmpR family regulator